MRKNTVAKECNSSLPYGGTGKFIHKIYTQNKDKFDRDKKSFKDDTNAIIAHCHMSDRPIQSMQICIQI